MYKFSDISYATRLAKRFRQFNPDLVNKYMTLTKSKELVAQAFRYKNWHELKVATEAQTNQTSEVLTATDYKYAVQAIADYWELSLAARYLVGTEIERVIKILEREQSSDESANENGGG